MPLELEKSVPAHILITEKSMNSLIINIHTEILMIKIVFYHRLLANTCSLRGQKILPIFPKSEKPCRNNSVALKSIAPVWHYSCMDS